MFEFMEKILSMIESDYADIRYELKKDTRITFNSSELSDVITSSSDGFVLRVLKNGGLASVSFTGKEDAEDAMRKAVRNAKILSENIENPINFADVEVIKDVYRPEYTEDPRNISIEEKIALTEKYNNIPLDKKEVISTSMGYKEVIREKYFMSTEGARIREDLVTNRIRGMITAGRNNMLQNVRVGVGGSTGFSILRDRENVFKEKTGIVLKLLDAKPVEGGKYNVILNPDIAGVFTHEAFGHFSEADLIENNPTMREKMKIGEKLGNEILNIVDDPTIPGQLGYYMYDDEGVRARHVQLMKNGVLTGRLHSRRTAAEFDEPVTGHCVAEDYRYAPIIRMGNIFIESGSRTFDELVSELGDGLYLLDHKGGQTSGENFTFGAQYGYIVEDGKVGEMVRDINISGNLYRTLQGITSIGNNLEFCELGGCGKGQLNIRSCNGAPHILVEDLVVGGRK